MIFRRIALVIALLCGLAMTQLPEFIQQYSQGLGRVIDELGAEVARFDADAAQQGLTEPAAIDRLHGNQDEIARRRADAIQDDIARLATLRDTQAAFRSEGPVGRLTTFVTHYDSRIARGTLSDYQPALQTSPEALALGLVGFVFGGGVVHLTGYQMRRRRRAPQGTVA